MPVSNSMVDDLLPCNPDPSVLDMLAKRRSTPLPLLGGPGPDSQTLEHILRIASRVPDHRKVVPWRFLVFEGRDRDIAAGEISKRFAKNNPLAKPEDVQAEGMKFTRAGVVVGLVSSPDMEHKTPVWEQELTVGAVGQNLLLASNASGFAGVWLTGWLATDPHIHQIFGLSKTERFAGFFHIGTSDKILKERSRPELSAIVSHWRSDELSASGNL